MADVNSNNDIQRFVKCTVDESMHNSDFFSKCCTIGFDNGVLPHVQNRCKELMNDSSNYMVPQKVSVMKSTIVSEKS